MSKKILASILVFALFIFGIHFTGYADEPLSVTAPSALLMDFDTGKVLYEKNSHEKRACASITKVMTLCLIFEAIDAGKIDYDTIVTTTPAAAAAGGSDIWLVEGEQMSVNDLIKAIVVASANDAAVAVAEHLCGSEKAFVEQMNKKAQELGMKDTLFKNCSGLDEEGHLTSAYDVALMSRELMKHEEIFNYTSIWLDYLRDGATQIVNTNKLLKTYNGITGLKTGTTDECVYGEFGEICISGPTVMKCYINNPVETADILRIHPDGRTWLHTGDLGKTDSDGYIYFDQRIKRIIITNGYNVYPTQIESVLNKCRYIELSCVIGLPDSKEGQWVKAFVQLKKNFEKSDDMIERILLYCKQNMSDYAIPKEIEFVDSFPMTFTGRIAYKEMMKLEQQRAEEG